MAMVRAEVLGAIERRRRWHYEDKVRIVEESFAAGMTVTDVARRNASLRAWFSHGVDRRSWDSWEGAAWRRFCCLSNWLLS
ncbi:transposase [Bosea vaviloviae]|uniref:transposase n=1 Tax=Bosea vaviloviae TaxID=1526658 RepID=UPI0009EC1E70|nr:transposase [Bosea vaviloviae]